MTSERCAACQIPPISGSPHLFRLDCLHRHYGNRFRRFVLAHAEAYREALLHHATSANQLERMATEYRTLPPRHSCTCWPTHCALCAKIDKQRPIYADAGVKIGRSTLGPRAPDPMILDILGS